MLFVEGFVQSAARQGRYVMRTGGLVRLSQLAAVIAAMALAIPAVAAASLPDGRAYELVTPPDLLGSSAVAISGTTAALPQPWGPVAADGNAVLWGTTAVLPGVDVYGTLGDGYLSRRSPTGWTWSQASPPGSKILAPSVPVWATPNLDRIVWLTFGATVDPTDLDPIGSGNSQTFMDLYSRELDGSFTRISQGSEAPPVSGESASFVGGSTDGLRVIFFDDRQLEPDASPKGGVYERVGQQTTFVSKDIDETPLAVEGDGASDGASDDGSVVAFTVFGAFGKRLYLRNEHLTHTVRVATASNYDLSSQGLSADGSKVFFTTSEPVTSDDIDTSKDLYEYDAHAEVLTRVSAPTGAPAAPGAGNTDACASPLPGSNGCNVAVVAISRDGSKVYFASPEQLDGAKGVEGAPNLYLSTGGETRFVATLDEGDPLFEGNAAAHFTPDGSKLMFESHARLTSYDNAGHIEIYINDPATGELTCASCRPSGMPPTGDASLRDGSGAAPNEFSGAPMYTANSDQHGDHIFFQSTDAVVPQDTNGHYDVYEYTASTGAVALISAGLSPSDSVYLGNGVDGRDVFFFTTDTLTPEDQNGGAYKIYDARVGGGFPVAAPRPACVADGCHSALSSPATFPTAGSVTFSGPGNLAAGASGSTVKVLGSRSKMIAGVFGLLKVKVPDAGRLIASGSGLATVKKTTPRAGTYTIRVSLTPMARKALKASGSVIKKVKLTFTPIGGRASTVTLTLTYKAHTATRKRGR